MNPCSSFVWDSTLGQWVCQSSRMDFYLLAGILAIIVLSSFLTVIAQRFILAEQEEILGLLRRLQPVTGLKIQQINWRHPMATGVKLGDHGAFSAAPQPSGSVLPAGVVPTWSVDDTNVTLTPSTDGMTCVASVPLTDTNTAFILTVKATLPDGSTPSGTLSVPILPAEVTSFTITQTA